MLLLSTQYLDDFNKLKSEGKETRTVRRQFLEQCKADKLCKNCKKIFPPYMLSFDHVKGKKIGNLTDIARSGTIEQLVEEMMKCELVCLNCHAHRTYLRSKNVKQPGVV